MASADRNSAYALKLLRQLEEEPYRFGFLEAVRRLDCLHPDKPRTGLSLRPRDEHVRFSQQPSLAFAPATLSAFEQRGEGRLPRLEVYFLGLFGPNGPLPLHLTEYARDRLRNSGDRTFARFLDIFHHRIIALFYRAWVSGEPTVSFDRPAQDRFAAYAGSLFGIGTPALQGRDAVPDLAKLYFAGHFACQSRHADGLRSIVSGYFGLPVRIDECVGQWLRLPEHSRLRLGESPETGSLGVSAVTGEYVWERQHKFRVVLGPLALDEYVHMLPGGDSLSRLLALVRNYAGDQSDWDVNLILRRDEAPETRLGTFGQLGWTTWLGCPERQKDVDDLRLQPLHYAA